jgi:hypothetical protein
MFSQNDVSRQSSRSGESWKQLGRDGARLRACRLTALPGRDSGKRRRLDPMTFPATIRATTDAVEEICPWS